MDTTLKLYTLNYTERKTYFWAILFVACNMVLPQLFHLIPQGGIIFAPLSFVILAGSCKFGWKTGLLAALASPVVNHFVFGMPAWGMVPVMAVKLAVLALVAGLAIRYFQRANLLMLVGIVLVSELLGGIGELLLTGGIATTLADFTLGWPGLLLQVLGTYALLHYIDRA
ncbi:MAG: ECF transporter S component [Bacteroidaceae bacterium]|nr:ECF transporter S component [Bacteroidaceae bacterium]